MGETADDYQVRWEETRRRYAAYKSDGKTPAEINGIFEREIMDRLKSKKKDNRSLLSFSIWFSHCC